MTPSISVDLQQLSGIVIVIIALLSAVGTALWVSMIIWAYRDMRSRSHDMFARILAALVVGVLNVPGLLVYLILRPAETLAQQYERALEEEALLQEIEGKTVCPGCSHPIKDTWRLCPYCHTRLKKPCQNCGALLDLPWVVCPYCEHSQTDQAYSARTRATTGQSVGANTTPPDQENR